MYLGNIAFWCLLILFGLASIGSAIVEGLLEIKTTDEEAKR